jgi:hypothetical protein
VFLGTHTPRLDEKGRLFLPAKYREEFAGGLVITKGQERCLYVFPVAEFGRIADGLRAPTTSKAVRDYSRVFFASASDETPDKQGWPATARSSGPTRAWRSGTPPHGSPTWRSRRTPSPRHQRRDCQGCCKRCRLFRCRVLGEVSTRAWAITSAGVTSPAPGDVQARALRGWGPGRAARSWPREGRPNRPAHLGLAR